MSGNSGTFPLWHFAERTPAALAGAGQKTVERIMNCINTSEAAAVLREKGILQPVLQTVMERMEFYLRQRAGDELTVEAVMFILLFTIYCARGNRSALCSDSSVSLS